MTDKKIKSLQDAIKRYNTDGNYKLKINNAIAETGIVLEKETDNKFIKNNYTAGSTLYTDIDEKGKEKRRELDIFSIKNFNLIKFNKKHIIRPMIYFVGDCKYFRDPQSCFIFASIEKGYINNTFLQLPLFTNGYILSNYLNNGNIFAKDFFKIFGKILITKRIDKFNFNIKELNKEEKSIFNICESQILPAIKHYHDLFFQEILLYNQYKGLYHLHDLEEKELYLPIYAIIPIIVTNRKLLEISINEEKFVVDNMIEHPFLIYNHSPSDRNKFISILENSPSQSILIINNKHLADAIKYIENGYKRINNKIKLNLKEKPKLLETDARMYREKMERIFNKIIS